MNKYEDNGTPKAKSMLHRLTLRLKRLRGFFADILLFPNLRETLRTQFGLL